MDESSLYQILASIISIIAVCTLSFLRHMLSTLSLTKLRQLEAEKNAALLLSMIKSPTSITVIMKSWHNTALLICGTIIGYGFCNEILIGIFPKTPVTELVASLIIINITDIIFWQIIPGMAEKVVLKLTGIYKFIYNISYPLFAVITFMLKPMLPKESELKEARKLTETDLLIMVEEASKQGVLEEEEKDMITSVFELSNTTAWEIMIPRLDIIAVERKTPISKVIDLAMEHGYSRLPVYEESIDKVIGIMHTKDLIPAIREHKMDMPIKKFMRKPLFIPNNKKIDEILRDMQEAKIAMAIVLDEYGGTDGLVTMEDVIEEIVGDIADEYDKDMEPIIRNEDGSYTIDGKTSIEYVNDFAGLELSDEEFETISGYVCGLAGHIPKEEEIIKDKNVSFVIEKVTGHRISMLKMAVNEMEQDENNNKISEINQEN